MAKKAQRKPAAKVTRKRKSPGAGATRAAARVKRARPVAKVARKKRAVSRRQSRPASPEGTNVGIALQEIDNAVRQLELSGHSLLRAIADLQDAAVDAHRAKLLRALVDDQVLQDLRDARAAFETAPEDEMPVAMRPFTLFPQALADWLERNLGLRPHGRRGQELEIQRDRLAEFTVLGSVPEHLPPLLRVRVEAHGWQSGAETLIKPTVVILAAPTAGTGELMR